MSRIGLISIICIFLAVPFVASADPLDDDVRRMAGRVFQRRPPVRRDDSVEWQRDARQLGAGTSRGVPDPSRQLTQAAVGQLVSGDRRPQESAVPGSQRRASRRPSVVEVSMP